MWHLLPPTALLLLVSATTGAADYPKAVVSLDPPWVRVLQRDRVTLKCQGAHLPGDTSIKWLHNGNLTSIQDSSYLIESASPQDSGQYQCQTGLSKLSDAVRLEVHSDWLLLQTEQWVFHEGDPIRMKCHSWKNVPVRTVTYLQNGRGKKFFHKNSELYIPAATHNDSGSYFCRGLIGNNNKSSETVNIIVQGAVSPSTSQLILPWHQIVFCLVMGLLFAVDTGMYFSVQKNLRSSMENCTDPKGRWSRDPQDK